jgi:S-adenosylmethionine decarboxylase
MKAMMHNASVVAKCNIVTECFHEFNPAGVSGCIIISESNFCLHTWHEHHYVAIDLFYCGDDVDIEAAVDYIVKSVDSKRVQRTDLSRGILKMIESHVGSEQ